MFALILLFFLILLCFGIGRQLLRLLGVQLRSFGEEVIFSIPLGLGILSTLVFLFGMLGWLYSWALYAVLGCIALLVVKEIGRFLKSLYDLFKRLPQTRFTKLQILLLALLCIHIILNSFEALAPVTASDTVTYHYAIPKLYIKSHEIYYMPGMYANQPMAFQMLYMLGMLLYADTLSSLFTYLAGILVVLGIYVVAKEYLSSSIGLLAAVLFYTTPLVTYVTGAGSPELGLTLFTFLGVYSSLKWWKEEDNKWLILCGIFAGFAAGTKYYGLFAIVALGITVLAASLSRAWQKGVVHYVGCTPCGYSRSTSQFQISKTLMTGIIFLVPALLVASPWYLKNLIYVGNPFFPALYSIFGGKDYNPETNALFKLMFELYKTTGTSIGNLLLVPWNLTVHSDRFLGKEASLGPLFLSFLPVLPLLLIFHWRRMKDEKWIFSLLIAFCSLYFLCWFFLAMQRMKHLLPLAPVLFLMTAYVIFSLTSAKLRELKGISIGVVAIVLLFSLSVNVIYNTQFLPVLLGKQSRDEFLTAKLRYYEPVQWINRNLSSTDKILHTEMVFNYYLDKAYIWPQPLWQGIVDWANIHSAEELLKILQQQKVTHIYLGDNAYAYTVPYPKLQTFYDKVHALLKDLKKNRLQPVYRDERKVSAKRTLGLGEKHIRAGIYKISYSSSAN